MAEVKRGRLNEVSIRPMYDDKGKVTGHTVRATHDGHPDERKKGDSWTPSPPPAETPHESIDSAIDMAKEHVQGNIDKHGKSSKGRALKDAVGS